MRKVAGILLIVSMPISAVVGSMYALSSASQSLTADVQSDDLSKVSADLVSADELAKIRAAAAERRKSTSAGKLSARYFLLACLLAGAALSALVAGVLLLVGRGARAAAGMIPLSLAGPALAVLLDRAAAMTLLSLGLILIAGALSLVARRRQTERP